MTSAAGDRRTRSQRLQLITLALTGVLTAALGGIIYLSITSIPYLAVSPATDPAFGRLNACLLAAVPERTGWAVSRDLSTAAAWSTNKLVVCGGVDPRSPAGSPAEVIAAPHALTGVTLGAFDGSGALWISQSGGDTESPRLMRFDGKQFVERGHFAPAALVGTANGVVALETQGQLIALAADGAVTATRALPLQRGVHLTVNSEGTHLALFGGGKFAVIDAKTLESTPAEAPCPVSWVWWRPGSPLLLVECVDIAIEVNAIDSRSTLLEPRQRIRSTLSGPTGVYVQSCDVLPCSATPPP
ncbi:MAG: hypothetical protein JNM17_33365 [Archangium sp.]|nr:hypothetical protein [Archangium sp.]